MKELHEKLRDLREDHDLRQEDIAQYLGVVQQAYSNYESGSREVPTWVVQQLAKYYQVSTDFLLGTEPGYLGSTDLKSTYLGNITLRDVLYNIQKLHTKERKELLKYIRYLNHTSS